MKPRSFVLVWVMLAMLALSGCGLLGAEESPTQQPGLPDNPEPATGEILEGEAPVESVEVLVLESFPVQVRARVQGYLPDGCTQLGDPVVTQEGTTFNVALKTARPSDAVCTEAIVPFDVEVPLPVEGLPAGDYTVNVNGQSATFGLAVDNVLPEDPQPTGEADPAAAACPEPAEGQNGHIDVESGFCFLFPAGFEVQSPEPGVTVVLGPVPEDSGPEPVAAYLNIDVVDAEGRTAQQFVDDQLAGYPGLAITQTPVTLGGAEAIALEGMPGLFPTRQIIAAQRNRMYVLTFSPLGEEFGEPHTQMLDLFNVVTSSWVWISVE